MILLLIVILTIASISLRITIGGLEIAFYVADRANSIRMATKRKADEISRFTDTEEGKNNDGSKSVIKKGFQLQVRLLMLLSLL